MAVQIAPRLIIPIYFCVVFIAIATIHARFARTGEAFSKERDVFFIYQDAERLARGVNPYARIAGENMNKNHKYTFYLPAFLMAAAAAIKLGLSDYQSWMVAWIYVSGSFHYLIGVLLFYFLYRKGDLLPAIFGSAFWFFSRWPLALFKSGQIDSVAILFFVLAIVCLERQYKLSMICFSISLAFKQMAAFVFPLYLVWSWQRSDISNRQRYLLKVCLYLLAVPFLLSLPFLFWDPESYFRMLVFPLTRAPRGPRSVEVFLGIPGFLGKLPYLAMLACVYWLAWKQRLDRYTQMFLVMITFLSFNGVFFSRYFCWAVPLIPIVCFQHMRLERSLGVSPKGDEPRLLKKDGSEDIV